MPPGKYKQMFAINFSREDSNGSDTTQVYGITNTVLPWKLIVQNPEGLHVNQALIYLWN